MDDALIENEDFGKRKSPRQATRKFKEIRKYAERINQSEARPSRKRKTVNYEEDPSYSEGDFEEDGKEQNKKVPGFRCSPHLVPELMEQLTEKQRGWVKKIAFSSLQHMVESRSPKSLTMWLVDRVDTKRGTLEVCGLSIDIKKGVERILQLPSGGMKVPQPLNGRCKVKRAKKGSSRSDDKHSDNGRGQSAKEATKVLLAETDNEVEFCQSFVMLVMCIYLAPTTSLNINRGFYPALMDVSKIKLLDWCGFIAEYLLRGIEEYRTSKASHIQVPGCVHILPLLYLDALIALKAIVLPEALALPADLPRIHFVGTDHLDFLASADVKNKTKDHVEYGLLQEAVLGRRVAKKPRSKKSLGRNSGRLSAPDIDSGDATSDAEESEQGEDSFVSDLIEEIRSERVEILKDLERKLEKLEQKILDRFNSCGVRRTSNGKNGLNNKRNSGGIKSTFSDVPVKEPPSKDTVQQTGNCSETRKNQEETEFERRLGVAGNSDGRDCGLANSGQLVLDECDIGNASGVAPELLEKGPIGLNQSDCCRRGIETGDRQIMDDDKRPIVVDGENVEDLRREVQEGGTEGSFGRESWYDELKETVNIGKEAASEAYKNRESVDNDNTGEIPLNLLSETAVKEAAPMYDNSPLHASPSHCDGVVAASVYSLGNDMLVGGVTISEPPIYDQSPVSTSFACASRYGKLNALLSIPEVADGRSEPLSQTLQPPLSSRAGSDDNGDYTPGAQNENSLRQSQSDSIFSQLANKEHAESETDSSNTHDSIESLSNDGSEYSDVPAAKGDSESERGADILNTTQDFLLTPAFSFGTQEAVIIPDGPPSPPPVDVRHIRPLENEIESGFRFRFGGSISSSTEKVFDRYNTKESSDPGIKFVLCKDASETYKTEVSNSSARISTRLSTVFNSDREKTKILIKGFHITKGEFVDALKPNGKVCKNFMGLCSVAIMADWDSKKRVILDQGIIRDLMRVGHECDHMSVAGRLLKLKIAEVEEIFLPVLTNHHWILIVIDIRSEQA